MDLGLKGKAIIVTGGTRGIGRATVEALLDEGARVAFCARSQDQVSTAVGQLSQRYGEDVVFGQVCDVANHNQLFAFHQAAITHFGGLDGYVANVSSGGQPGDEGWDAALAVDLRTSVKGVESVIGDLVSSQGSVVMITSISATEVTGDLGGYGPAKAALLSYASQLGEAAGRQGVRVNCISPGPIKVEDGFWGNVAKSNPDVITAVSGQHPFGRLGTPDEVGRAVAFLLSPAASWISRVNLVVDGGFSRRVQF